MFLRSLIIQLPRGSLTFHVGPPDLPSGPYFIVTSSPFMPLTMVQTSAHLFSNDNNAISLFKVVRFQVTSSIQFPGPPLSSCPRWGL